MKVLSEISEKKTICIVLTDYEFDFACITPQKVPSHVKVVNSIEITPPQGGRESFVVHCATNFHGGAWVDHVLVLSGSEAGDGDEQIEVARVCKIFTIEVQDGVVPLLFVKYMTKYKPRVVGKWHKKCHRQLQDMGCSCVKPSEYCKVVGIDSIDFLTYLEGGWLEAPRAGPPDFFYVSPFCHLF